MLGATSEMPLHGSYDSLGWGLGSAHFGSGLVGCEHPLNTRARSVAVSFPSCDFGAEAGLPAAIRRSRALAAQDADFDHSPC